MESATELTHSRSRGAGRSAGVGAVYPQQCQIPPDAVVQTRCRCLRSGRQIRFQNRGLELLECRAAACGSLRNGRLILKALRDRNPDAVSCCAVLLIWQWGVLLATQAALRAGRCKQIVGSIDLIFNAAQAKYRTG